MMLRDPYEVLGVDKGATPQEIKSACELLHTLPDHCRICNMMLRETMCHQHLSRHVSRIYVLTRLPGMGLLKCC